MIGQGFLKANPTDKEKNITTVDKWQQQSAQRLEAIPHYDIWYRRYGTEASIDPEFIGTLGAPDIPVQEHYRDATDNDDDGDHMEEKDGKGEAAVAPSSSSSSSSSSSVAAIAAAVAAAVVAATAATAASPSSPAAPRKRKRQKTPTTADHQSSLSNTSDDRLIACIEREGKADRDVFVNMMQQIINKM
jgi:hypothetical protein